MKINYYKRLDIIRLISCIAVLLYHLNLLKGGYLAVCTFFVLTGYLSVISANRKEKFSIRKYYIDRFKKIYIPFIIVVFSSIAVISLFKSINWLNLKPETTSVLLGYNNYWQLNANLDYFVRHISSPFMHFWYIAILIQFEIIFPFIFVIFKKISEKISKFIPFLFFFILGIASYILFFNTIDAGKIMNAYYGSFTRAFSLLFGISLGFYQIYFKPLIFRKKEFNKIIFTFYILLLITSYFIMDVKFCSFTISMLLTTIISMRLIDYSHIQSKKEKKTDKIVKSLSDVSYEIYLVQYPVIFIFQNIVMNSILKVILIILITIIISYLIHFSLKIKKSKAKVLSIILLLLFSSISIFGFYQYIITKDHTQEMKKLEENLNENSKLIEEQKKKYLEKKKNEEDEWQKVLDDYNASEEELKETVKNLRVVGIGDSIMELAIRDLYREFPNGYFDAKTNRTEHEVNGILSDLKSKGLLGDIIILNIGTNGGWSKKNKEELLKIVGDRKIFWLNATHPDYPIFNDQLIEFEKQHDNVYIIDWISVAKKHPEYIISDKVHPTVKGCKVYAETIYKGIYNYYLNEFNKKKEERIKEHQALENKKIVFIGNELLLGMYNYIQDDYKDSEFIMDKKFTYKSLKEKIEEKINDKSLAHNIVLMFDNKVNLTSDNYIELFKILKDYKIYLITTLKDIDIKEDNVTIIDFKNEIDKKEDYISFDKVHLSEKGSNALRKKIIDTLNKI